MSRARPDLWEPRGHLPGGDPAAAPTKKRNGAMF